MTFDRENLQNFTTLEEKIPSIRSQMTGESGKFESEFNEIRLKVQIEVKMRKGKKTLERENFTILQAKIHSIRSERRGENHEFESQLKEIRLKIETEVKMGKKKEKKRHFKDKI